MCQISISEIQKSLDLEIVFNTLRPEDIRIKKIKAQKILFELITESHSIDNQNIHIIGNEEAEYLHEEASEIQERKLNNSDKICS